MAGVAGLLVWGWLDVRGRAIPATGRQGQKTDITVYLEAGRALRTGQNIYEVRNGRNWPYLYPPLPAVLFVPLSHLSRGQASYAWFVVSLGCLAGSVLAIRAALRPVDLRRAELACGLGLVPVALPALHTLQRGQVNALALLCVCLAVWAMARRRGLWAGVALAGAASIKVTPGLAGIYFVYEWLRYQVQTVRAGAWRPMTLLHRTQPLLGMGGGLVLGLWLIPALYMGAGPAGEALVTWRAKVAGGYFRPDGAGNLFGDTAGIHDTSNKNQTWYRVAVSTISLMDADALQSRDLLRPDWQWRVRWILAGVGIALAGGILWLSRTEEQSGAGGMASLAALAWAGITLGKIAWGHFHMIAYPLMAIAWLIAWRERDPRQGRQLQAMLALMTLAAVVHYSVASQSRISDLGGILLPMTVLALAIVTLANRPCRPVHCEEPCPLPAQLQWRNESE